MRIVGICGNGRFQVKAHLNAGNAGRSDSGDVIDIIPRGAHACVPSFAYSPCSAPSCFVGLNLKMRSSTPACSGLLLLAGLLGVHATANRQQIPLAGGLTEQNYYDEEGYTLFRHVDYPEKQMRYKRNDGWCDGADTKSWSGYLDFEDSHLFFYYFESRSKPAEDPVVLWINGGPGCSSSMGMLMELGPCQIVEEGDPYNTTATTKVNPYSWNSNANLLFLDQPWVELPFSVLWHSSDTPSLVELASAFHSVYTDYSSVNV